MSDQTTAHSSDRGEAAAALDLSAYLPAVYLEKPADNDPLRTVVTLFESFVISIEQHLDHLPELLDPQTAPQRPDDVDHDFLGWLARWVALDPEQDLPRRVTDQPARTADAERRWRFLIGTAAKLYRIRGTVAGLRYMLATFCDADIEILEWAWPQGLTIGLSSSIGVDTYITDQPDTSSCFTVVWRSELPIQEDGEPAVTWIPIRLAGASTDRSALAEISDRRDAISGTEFARRLAHLRRLLDQEKPAHTHAYLALQPAPSAPDQPAPLEAMVIGVTSKIGLCIIDRPAISGELDRVQKN